MPHILLRKYSIIISIIKFIIIISIIKFIIYFTQNLMYY